MGSFPFVRTWVISPLPARLCLPKGSGPLQSGGPKPLSKPKVANREDAGKCGRANNLHSYIRPRRSGGLTEFAPTRQRIREKAPAPFLRVPGDLGVFLLMDAIILAAGLGTRLRPYTL